MKKCKTCGGEILNTEYSHKWGERHLCENCRCNLKEWKAQKKFEAEIEKRAAELRSLGLE